MISAFAELGRALRLATFAEAIADQAILASIQDILEQELGDLVGISGVTLSDSDAFQGTATERIGLSKTRSFRFSVSEDEISYRVVDPASSDMSDEDFQDLVEFAAAKKAAGKTASTSKRAGKKLNCKPGNVQCGGRCQSDKKNCRFAPSPAQKEQVKEAVAKVKKEKVSKPKAAVATKPKAEETAKPKEAATEEAKKTSKPAIASYDSFKKEAMNAIDRIDEDYNYGNVVPIHRVRKELGDRVKREEFDEWMTKLQSDGAIRLVGGELEQGSSEKDSIKTKLGQLRSFVNRLGDKPKDNGRGEEKPAATKGKAIESYDSFEKEILSAYKKIGEKEGDTEMVPIYRMRRELGDRLTRQQFNAWMLDAQAKNLFTLLEGSVEDSAEDKIRDSVMTKLGKIRAYAKLRDRDLLND